MRVNVTGQSYDYFRPWQKKAPFSKRALGAVLSKGRVLVTANLVANQNYVELERAESGEKSAATVEVIDYEANLALLEPAEKNFLDGITPLEIAPTPSSATGCSRGNWNPPARSIATEGLVTTIQMMRYPTEVGQFLTYRLSMSMQYRENSYTVPLVKKNKLAGLLLRYDPRSQLVDAIPAPIITHFLKEAESGHYRGFPSAGFSFFPDTRSGAARNTPAQTGKPGGVYVTSVEPNIAGDESRHASRATSLRSVANQRDRPKRQLRRSSLRQNRVHELADRTRIRRRHRPIPNPAPWKADAAESDSRASRPERLYHQLSWWFLIFSVVLPV